MQKIILAVDAGGTKTKVCAFNCEKEIVYETIGGIGSPAVIKDEAFENIKRLLNDAFNFLKDKYEVTFIQMGISGLGVVKDVKSLEKEFSQIYEVEVSMDNDAILALYSIVTDEAKEGILVLSGTGSACYGINNQETLLIGGFGHLLTEVGSSYTAVRMLVMSIIDLYEETKTYSDLGRKFMNLIDAKTIYDFKIFMYQKTKAEIAEYAKFISDEAKNGDPFAADILRKCGKDLAHSVSLLYKHLSLSPNTVIGFRGSFILHAYLVKEELMRSLELIGFNPRIVEGFDDPIYGAFYMALRKNKIC